MRRHCWKSILLGSITNMYWTIQKENNSTLYQDPLKNHITHYQNHFPISQSLFLSVVLPQTLTQHSWKNKILPELFILKCLWICLVLQCLRGHWMSLLDHRGEKRLPSLWRGYIITKRECFFSASSVMLHITWVHWVSASIVPVKDAPKKESRFSLFKAEKRINP